MRVAIHLAFILLVASVALVAEAEEPFSFAKTPGKLPKTVVPQHYTIHIEPDIQAASLVGTVAIEIKVLKPVREIVLNSLGLEISNAMLEGAAPVPLTPSLDAERQTLTLGLPRELVPGTYDIRLSFRGKLTEQPLGLYILRYKAAGTEGRALATQMEPADARRMFPCWDEPVFRATFQLTVVVPEKQFVVSNMPITRERVLENAKKEVAFDKTPSMSTYLMAFCAGEMEELKDEVDGVQLRIIMTPGRREQGRYAMEITKKMLPWFNEYFGTKYPLPKLDQIAFPSTGASGMENWGAIIYNDTALLYDPAKSSQSAKERVFGVVAHELAHQWFGNLVTMAWWDNLWLNEGFASWMGTKATDHFNPEWKAWLRAAEDKEYAMQLDARATTHPIQQPITDESQATSAFDEITYLKGQSFLRMLESWLGEAPFREGIRKYMQRHAYGSTTTADLWRALEESSGKKVSEMTRGWTEQPGFPVVKVSEHLAKFSLAQERFTIHQPGAEPLQWMIPVMLGRAPALKETLVMLEPGKVEHVSADFAPFKANFGDVGYYRVQYEDALFAKLAQGAAQLSEADRLNLLNDTWALVQAKRAPAAAYFDLATRLREDQSFPVASQIIDAFWKIEALLRGEAAREKFHATARELLAPQLARLGWDAAPDESKLTGLLRGELLTMLGAFGHEDVKREAQARFAKFLNEPKSLTADLRRAVFFVTGRAAGEGTWEKLHELIKREESLEQKRQLLRGLAASVRAEDASRTLALAMTDELPPADAAGLVHRVASLGERPEEAWKFAQLHLDALLAKCSSLAANEFVPEIFRSFTDASRVEELEAFAKKRLPPGAANEVAKAADEIRFHAELKTRLLPEIEAWSKAQAK